MLALVVALALSQCTKDTDCKGDRICQDGVCVGDAPRVDAVPAPPPVVTPTEPTADEVRAERVRVMAMGRLDDELRELRFQLDDATLAGPIVKLVGATGLVALAIVSTVTWLNINSCLERRLYSCGDPAVAVGGVALSMAGAVALYIWGGVQLAMRLNARWTLPREIEAKETELAQLRAIQARRAR